MRTMDEAIEIVAAIRGLKSAFDIKQNVSSRVAINLGDNEELERDIASLVDFIMTQSNTKSLKFHSRRGLGDPGRPLN